MPLWNSNGPPALRPVLSLLLFSAALARCPSRTGPSSRIPLRLYRATGSDLLLCRVLRRLCSYHHPIFRSISFSAECQTPQQSSLSDHSISFSAECCDASAVIYIRSTDLSSIFFTLDRSRPSTPRILHPIDSTTSTSTSNVSSSVITICC